MQKFKEVYQGKHCWVLGGAGFIGRYVTRSLLDLGAKVFVFDDFSRGGEASRKLLSHILEGYPEGRFHRHSFGDFRKCPSEADCFRYMPRPEFIFHLAAAMGDIVHNRCNHYPMMMDNLCIHQAVCDMLEGICQNSSTTLIYTSTACVFGRDVPVPTPEEYGRICDPEPTNHGYGIGKWVGEQMFYRLHQERLPHIKLRIARFFNAYANWGDLFLDRPHVIPALIAKVERNELPLMVLGSGNQTRTFVHAQDLTKGLLLLGAAQDHEFYGYPDEPDWHIVNIGSDHEHTIREVAETILELENKPQQIVYLHDEPEGYPRRAADTTRLKYLSKKVLGKEWVPGDPFRQTIQEAIQDYRNRLNDGTLI